MVLAPEISYALAKPTAGLKMDKQVAKVQPQGQVDANNRRATFEIPSYDTQLIQPHSVRVCGHLEISAGFKLVNSFAHLIDSVTVYSANGTEISRTTQLWRLHSMVADLELDASHASSHFQIGLDKRDSVVLASKLERDFSIPLNLTGLFSTNKLILPSDFGGLRIVVQFRSALECIAGTTPTYTLSNVHLTYDYSDISGDMDALKLYEVVPKDGRQYPFTVTETFTTSVPSATTGQIRIQCPVRLKDIRKITTGLFDGANDEARLRGNVVSYQCRVGSKVYPTDRVDTLPEMMDLTQSAYGGASRGILTYDAYNDARFMVAQPFSNLSMIGTGLDPKDATTEVILEVQSGQTVGKNCSAVAFVQGDAVWSSKYMMVSK